MCLILSFATLFSVVAVTVSAGSLKPDGTAPTVEEMKELVNTTSYSDYILSYDEQDMVKGIENTIVLDYDDLDVGSNNSAVKVSESDECIASKNQDQSAWAEFDWDANAATSLYLPAMGSTTWNFSVSDTSLYYIRITYFNCTTSESSISTIERKLFIDGRIEFTESSYISLSKHWTYDNISETVTDTTEPDMEKTEYDTRDDGYYKIVTIVKDGKKTVRTYKMSQDINGNSMAPTAVQDSRWNTYYCQDSTGFYQGYFKFHFLEGTHTLTLQAEREPVIIKSIELVPYDMESSTIPTYAEVQKDYADKGYKAPSQNKTPTLIEAEFPDFVSDSSVYATNDNSSAANEPHSSKAQLYNVIGENSYRSIGQWAAYKFTVSENGLYKFGMRFKQDALQGMFICRAIKLVGGHYGNEPAVPFQEAYNTRFNYADNWQSAYVGDGENVFEFYFEEGVEYTLYLECSLGSLKDLLQRVSASMDRINDAYLKILKLTGNDPDEYRDYNFLDIMPEVLISLLEEAMELEAIKDEFEELCGTNGSHITTLHTIAMLLDTMGSDDGYNIAANMATLKSYLGTLGTWINNSQASAMVLDCISVCPSDADEKALRQANPGFFQSLFFEISSFFYSFFTDYQAMGLTSVPDENSRRVQVWLATGRDQSNIWRTLIDAQGSFSDSTGVAATLKLVTAGTLLPSILSGKGPDVYMGLGSADVINYAIRDAVLGISGNDPRLDDETNKVFSSNYYTYKDAEGNYEVTAEYRGEENLVHKSLTFNEVVDGNFADVAMDTIALKGVAYGIPDTMTMAMMFYRMDILANLGQEVPDTWSQLLALLPVLQTNNMSIGVSYASAINFMIYQNDENMWKLPDDPEYAGYEVNLDDDEVLKAFDYVCRLYSDYSFPISYDAANRFRTGEMPILIGDYGALYNQLIVYATEIAGLWEFGSLPGTQRADGTLNYDSIVNTTATVMLHGCDDVLAAWQFIQWETSNDVQASYGNKMVALIGPSAKYESANLNAIKNLSWTASERAAIENQMNHISSVVNYPGSYIIARYTKFAFLAAVNDGENAVEALQGYVDAINAEIKRKREEFGLQAPPADYGQ